MKFALISFESTEQRAVLTLFFKSYDLESFDKIHTGKALLCQALLPVCLPIIMSHHVHDKISQAFSLRFCIL